MMQSKLQSEINLNCSSIVHVYSDVKFTVTRSKSVFVLDKNKGLIYSNVFINKIYTVFADLKKTHKQFLYSAQNQEKIT